MTTTFLRKWFSRPVRPRIVTLGNQKGGSGKTTTGMHLMVGLMNCGYKVGCLDLDGDQATLSHFMENRKRQSRALAIPLDMPAYRRIDNSLEASVASSEEDETQRLDQALTDLQGCDYVVIDTPGHDSFLSRMGHILAEHLITPMNDSFLDLDVLVRLDTEGRKIIGPSSYSVAVLDRWGLRMLVTGKPLDWLVIRNRLAHLDNRNNRQIEKVLHQLAPRLGFRMAHGFGERVIYRELFPKGLTLLDPVDEKIAKGASSSRAAARDEVWALMNAIGLKEGTQAEFTWKQKAGLPLSGMRNSGGVAGGVPGRPPLAAARHDDHH